MKLEITADKVKEAAAKCPQAEATLKTLFPEVFKRDEHFDFGQAFEIDTAGSTQPFFIGEDMAPDGLEYKCLIAHPEWDFVIKTEGSVTIIIPKRK